MSTEHATSPITTRSEMIDAFLTGERVAHELVEHEPTASAAQEGEATHHPAEAVAKTVVLHDGRALVIVALPATRRLDLHRLRGLLGATGHLRMATEAEIARDFPDLEVGAIPPFGPMVTTAEVIDRSLLEHPRVLCPAGDHRHSVLLAPAEIVRITGATVGDICAD